MQNYIKFFLIWTGFTILLLAGAWIDSLYELENTQQSLEQTQKQVQRLEKQNAELVKDWKKANQTLRDTNGQLQKTKKELQKITTIRKTLQQRNDELRQQANQKDTQIKKLEISKANKVVNSHVRTASVDTQAPSKGRVVRVKATAYTAYCKGCSGTTSTGLNLRANPHLKVIAVDPNVIPLGSKVYVEGYGYAIAADKGGGIKGHEADIFMPSEHDANVWGVQHVDIHVY